MTEWWKLYMILKYEKINILNEITYFNIYLTKLYGQVQGKLMLFTLLSFFGILELTRLHLKVVVALSFFWSDTWNTFLGALKSWMLYHFSSNLRLTETLFQNYKHHLTFMFRLINIIFRSWSMRDFFTLGT